MQPNNTACESKPQGYLRGGDDAIAGHGLRRFVPAGGKRKRARAHGPGAGLPALGMLAPGHRAQPGNHPVYSIAACQSA